MQSNLSRLQHFALSKPQWALHGDRFQMSLDGKSKTAADTLAMPEISLQNIIDVMCARGELTAAGKVELEDRRVYDTVESICKYAVYIDKQMSETTRNKNASDLAIPLGILYSADRMPELSTEELEKLNKIKPATLGEVSSISGMSAHAVTFLFKYILKFSRQNKANNVV